MTRVAGQSIDLTQLQPTDTKELAIQKLRIIIAGKDAPFKQTKLFCRVVSMPESESTITDSSTPDSGASTEPPRDPKSGRFTSTTMTTSNKECYVHLSMLNHFDAMISGHPLEDLVTLDLRLEGQLGPHEHLAAGSLPRGFTDQSDLSIANLLRTACAHQPVLTAGLSISESALPTFQKIMATLAGQATSNLKNQLISIIMPKLPKPGPISRPSLIAILENFLTSFVEMVTSVTARTLVTSANGFSFAVVFASNAMWSLLFTMGAISMLLRINVFAARVQQYQFDSSHLYVMTWVDCEAWFRKFIDLLTGDASSGDNLKVLPTRGDDTDAVAMSAVSAENTKLKKTLESQKKLLEGGKGNKGGGPNRDHLKQPNFSAAAPANLRATVVLKGIHAKLQDHFNFPVARADDSEGICFSWCKALGLCGNCGQRDHVSRDCPVSASANADRLESGDRASRVHFSDEVTDEHTFVFGEEGGALCIAACRTDDTFGACLFAVTVTLFIVLFAPYVAWPTLATFSLWSAFVVCGVAPLWFSMTLYFADLMEDHSGQCHNSSSGPLQTLTPKPCDPSCAVGLGGSYIVALAALVIICVFFTSAHSSVTIIGGDLNSSMPLGFSDANAFALATIDIDGYTSFETADGGCSMIGLNSKSCFDTLHQPGAAVNVVTADGQTIKQVGHGVTVFTIEQSPNTFVELHVGATLIPKLHKNLWGEFAFYQMLGGSVCKGTHQGTIHLPSEDGETEIKLTYSANGIPQLRGQFGLAPSDATVVKVILLGDTDAGTPTHADLLDRCDTVHQRNQLAQQVQVRENRSRSSCFQLSKEEQWSRLHVQLQHANPRSIRLEQQRRGVPKAQWCPTTWKPTKCSCGTHRNNTRTPPARATFTKPTKPFEVCCVDLCHVMSTTRGHQYEVGGVCLHTDHGHIMPLHLKSEISLFPARHQALAMSMGFQIEIYRIDPGGENVGWSTDTTPIESVEDSAFGKGFIQACASEGIRVEIGETGNHNRAGAVEVLWSNLKPDVRAMTLHAKFPVRLPLVFHAYAHAMNSRNIRIVQWKDGSRPMSRMCRVLGHEPPPHSAKPLVFGSFGKVRFSKAKIKRLGWEGDIGDQGVSCWSLGQTFYPPGSGKISGGIAPHKNHHNFFLVQPSGRLTMFSSSKFLCKENLAAGQRSETPPDLVRAAEYYASAEGGSCSLFDLDYFLTPPAAKSSMDTTTMAMTPPPDVLQEEIGSVPLHQAPDDTFFKGQVDGTATTPTPLLRKSLRSGNAYAAMSDEAWTMTPDALFLSGIHYHSKGNEHSTSHALQSKTYTNPRTRDVLTIGNCDPLSVECWGEAMTLGAAAQDPDAPTRDIWVNDPSIRSAIEEAQCIELNQLLDTKCLQLDLVTNATKRIGKCVEVVKLKRGEVPPDSPPGTLGAPIKWKYRLCACEMKWMGGYLSEEVTSPVINIVTFKLLMAIGAYFAEPLRILDFVGAYCQSDPFEPEDVMWMDLPKGFEMHNSAGIQYCAKILVPLYGTRRAAQLWNEKINHDLCEECGMKRSVVDNCLYYKHEGSDWIFLGIHVDDCPSVASSHEYYLKFVSNLSKRFKFTDLGIAKHVLGGGITHRTDPFSIEWNFEAYIAKLAKSVGREHMPPREMPFPPGLSLGDKFHIYPMTEVETATVAAYDLYQRIGQLQFPISRTMPAGGGTMLQIAKRAHPDVRDIKVIEAADWLLDWCFTHRTKGVRFTHGESMTPIGAGDATGQKMNYSAQSFVSAGVWVMGAPVWYRFAVTSETLTGACEAEGLVTQILMEPDDPALPYEYAAVSGTTTVEVPFGAIIAGRYQTEGLTQIRNILTELSRGATEETAIFDGSASLVLTDCQPWFKIVTGRSQSAGKKHWRLRILDTINHTRNRRIYVGDVPTKKMICDLQTKSVSNKEDVRIFSEIWHGHRSLMEFIGDDLKLHKPTKRELLLEEQRKQRLRRTWTTSS